MELCKDNQLNFSVVSGGCSGKFFFFRKLMMIDVIATMLKNVMDILDYEQFKIYGNEMIFKDGTL
jgi:hypothetical protein